MPARTLKPRTSLLTLLGELRYTLSRLLASLITSPLAAPFQALRGEWTTVQAKEIACSEAVSDAQALVDEADDACDDFAGRLSKTALVITGDDRSHPLYVHFFGGKSLTEFRKPVLNGQLDAMKKWIDTLTTSPHASLQAMAPELVTLVDQADKALAQRDQARQARRKFRDIGERRQLVDHLNAERKALHGALTKVAIETPGLPSDFAAHFFRADPAGEEAAEATVEDVTQEIADLEEQLAAAKEKLATLQKAADDAAKAAAEKQADEAALAELEKEETELAKKKAALKKKVGKG